MTKKISMIKLQVSKFEEILKKSEMFSAQSARLIPFYKLGDEKALTSVFLSSLKLIKEFRKMIFSNINLNSSGKIHVFTEMNFHKHPTKHKIPDGFIFIEKSGKIVDAALLEVKNEKSNLDKDQINDYIDIANSYNIPKLITVSNQFVSHPTQSPLVSIKKKKVELYHLSWSLILTIAQILYTDNDTNIEDPDQMEIIGEVIEYLNYSKSGVCGFTEMKKGWSKITDRLHKRETIKKKDSDAIEAVESWLQEEKDMALILSRELGVLVNTGDRKYKDDLRSRIENEVNTLIEKKHLESIIKINGAASNIQVRANFIHRSIEFSTSMVAPQDKSTLKGQIGWIKKQLQRMEIKNPNVFKKIKEKLIISLRVKNLGEEKKSINELDDFGIKNKDRYLKDYGIVLSCDMGKNFGAKINSIKKIEESLLDYYQGVVQHLSKWQKPAPEIKNREIVDEN